MTSLITADALARMLGSGREDLVVLDVQHQLGGPPHADLYAAGHVPGAASIDLDAVLAGPPGPGGRHPLPDPAVLQEGLRAAGVRAGDAVVVYDQRTSLAAARAWWVLLWAGLDQVRVLDGGLAAWRAAGQDVSTDPVSPEPGDVSVRPGSLPVLDAAGAARVAEEGVLVDARTPERYRGEDEPVDPVAGRIPASVNVPMAELLDDEGRLLPADALRARFHAVGAHRGGDAPVGAYCGSGITAAHTVLAMDEAGIAAIPYIGSWSAWITDPDRPVATG